MEVSNSTGRTSAKGIISLEASFFSLDSYSDGLPVVCLIVYQELLSLASLAKRGDRAVVQRLIVYQELLSLARAISAR